MKKLILAITTLLIMAGPAAFAQRTSRGYTTLALSAGITDTSLDTELAVGINGIIGYWNIGVRASNRATLLSPTYDALSFLSTVADGGYMFRLVSSVDRRLNLYAGADVFLGAETVDPMGTIPAKVIPPVQGTKFIYGFQGNLSFEWYVFNASALTLHATLPVTFGTQHPYGLFSYIVSIGFKTTLF